MESILKKLTSSIAKIIQGLKCKVLRNTKTKPSSINVPILIEGEYSVLSVELNTGIVLKTNGDRYLGQGEVFWIFETNIKAKDFIKENIEINPLVEYSLFDCKGNFEFVASIKGQRKK